MNASQNKYGFRDRLFPAPSLFARAGNATLGAQQFSSARATTLQLAFNRK